MDIGLSPGPDGELLGDVDFDAAEPLAAALTPKKGGVGAVTTAVLMAHTVEAAMRKCGLEEYIACHSEERSDVGIRLSVFGRELRIATSGLRPSSQ